MTPRDVGAATVRQDVGPVARPAAIAALVGVLLGGALSGCSTMQALNPFGDDDKPKSEKATELPTDQAYPNLADVPGRPPRAPALERDKIAQGLAADRENAQYTDEQVHRPEMFAARTPRPASQAGAQTAAAPTPSQPAAQPPTPPAAPAASAPNQPPTGASQPPPPPVASAPLPVPPTPNPNPTPPPAPQTAALPPPTPSPVPSAPLPAAPTEPVVGASTTRQPPLPPGSPYAQPADVPVNPAAPPGQMVNNQPVITPGFYGTQAPVAAAAPATQLNPTATTAPPPAAAGQNMATPSPPDPTVAPRAQSVIQRDTLPPAAPPPPVPSDIAPVPSAPAVSSVPPPSPQQNLASLPPAAAAAPTSPSQLDEALHRTFPAAGPSSVGGAGIEALAATIYFRDGSAGMSPDDLTVVREVVRLHRERGGTVHVVGYASPDAAGGDVVAKRVANLELAGRRADAVSHELGRFGVAPGAIIASAEGATPPPDPGATGFGAAAARRVDIYLAY